MGFQVFGTEVRFNEDVVFVKKLKLPGNGLQFDGDATIGQNITFLKDVTIGGDINLTGSGSSITVPEIYADLGLIGILTVTKRLDVGIGGSISSTGIKTTVLGETERYFSVGFPQGNLFRVQEDTTGFDGLDNIARVSVAAPDGEVLDSARFQVGPSSKQGLFGDQVQTFVVTGFGTVGIASTQPSSYTNDGTIKLDVDGSAGIGGQLYDSRNLKGNPGDFLSKDENGITWVSFEPSFTEGIFLMDEGVYVPIPGQGGVVGAGQSFKILNFVQGNSGGIGSDTVVPTSRDPGDATVGLATITTFDLWGYDETAKEAGITTGIYRMTNVGIGSTQPKSKLDVVGDTFITGFLTVTNKGTFNSDLLVEGLGEFTDETTSSSSTNGSVVFSGGVGIGKELNVGEDSKFESDTESVDSNTGSVIFSGGVGIAKKVNIAGVLKVENTTDSVDLNTGALIVDGGAGIELKLNVGTDLDVGNNAKINGTTDASDKDTGALIVEGGVGIEKKLFVGNDLDVGNNAVINGTTESEDKDTGALVVEGGVGIEKKLFVGTDLDVGNNAKINGTEDASDKDTGALIVEGGAGIEKKLFVGTDLDVGNNAVINGTTDASNKDTGALIVEGGAGIEKKLFVGTDLDVGNNAIINGTTDASDKDTGALIVEGGVGIEKKLFVGSDLDVTATGKINSTESSSSPTTGALIVVGGVGIGENLNVDDNAKIGGSLELESTLIDQNDETGEVGKDYRLASVGTGVSWRPSGVETKKTIWVSKSGDDTNSGLLEGDAKATVGAAASVAAEGDTIKIRPGRYVENNPIGLRTDVSVTGEDLRLVSIVPNYVHDDVFHVRRGCLIENLNFQGLNGTATGHDGGGCVAFPPTVGDGTSARTGYLEPGPATEGSSGRWRSPYVRNCTNFLTGSIGMKINGDHATSADPDSGSDLKSMVCDSFTQYNEAGIGVSLTNDSYAQLVSIFTINCDIAIYADTGGQCDLTNSNSSFGNFGLVAVGLGSTQYTGVTSNTNTSGNIITSNPPEIDKIVAAGVTDAEGDPQRPFDGQALYFKIDLSNYPDTPGTGRISTPMKELSEIVAIEGANLDGFSAASPPAVRIIDADTIGNPGGGPLGPQGIVAEGSATVDETGRITEFNVIASGRNYLDTQNLIVDVGGNTAIATAITEPIYFTVLQSTPNVGGITTITFNEFIPYEVFPDDPFTLQRISRILTSSHSFEYVGTGTDINTSTPLVGGVPIKANEIRATKGAQIPFTSTDQKGNFDIGTGLQIDQVTSTIRGRDFSRAIQAEVTPLILALT